jgi:3',5'-cyclic AMP phosphodiesterase CpdA
VTTVLIVQISDCHIVEPGRLVADRVDPAPPLIAAFEQIAELSPSLIVATGDLVNEGRPAQYDRLQELLSGAQAPVIPLPGNHDDRTELRRRFAAVLPSGGPDDPIDHVVDHGELRLIMLDTQVPGSIAGRFGQAQAEWLDQRLTEGRDRPTIIFQHHPPFATGIRFMDREAFVGGDLEAEVLRRHDHVELVSCGHVHRLVQRRFGGTIACTWPSTAVALGLGVLDDTVQYSTEPTGFVVHEWEPGAGLRSHLQPVGTFDRWTPEWALRR